MIEQKRDVVVARLIKSCLVAVIRCSKAEQVMPVCEALLAGGITALEITLTTPKAVELIGQAAHQFGDRALVGAGSVLNGESCREVIQAGAQFVVSPISKAVIAQVAHVSSLQ